MSIKTIFLNNIGIKFLALILAVLSWFYIIGEIKKEMTFKESSEKEKSKIENTHFEPKIITKTVPIYPKIKGKPLAGHKVVEEQITVTPATTTLKGSVELLDKISFVSTETINVGGQNKLLVKKVSLGDLPREVEASPQKEIEVIIPIDKIKR